MSDENTEYRVLETPFFGEIVNEILDAVRGQMSDGLWENSRGYEKYWTNFTVVRNSYNRTIFRIKTRCGGDYYGRWQPNPFVGMKESEFFAWLGGKLKAVIQAEAKDNGWTKGWWNRDNTWQKSCYLNHKNEVTVADVYCVYDWLMGRIDRSPAAVHDRCFGEVADAETVEKRQAVEAERKRITDEYNARLASAEKTFNLQKEAAAEAYRAALAALPEVA